MQWFIIAIGGVIGWFFSTKKNSDAGLVGNVNTAAKVKPLQKEIDTNTATINAEQATLKQDEKKVQDESLQEIQSYFDTNLKS